MSLPVTQWLSVIGQYVNKPVGTREHLEERRWSLGRGPGRFGKASTTGRWSGGFSRFSRSLNSMQKHKQTFTKRV